MLPMTRHKALHTGLVSPSPLDRWINALLCGLAMLVSFAASICSMRLTRCPAECHSDATLEALPCTKSGKLRETPLAAASSHTERARAPSSTARDFADENAMPQEGLMRTIALAIVDSKHETWLTDLSTSHSRARPDDLGSHRGGTRSNPHDLPTEILEMRFAYPRMTRCLSCVDTTPASAPN
jgi:hypothetical protein